MPTHWRGRKSETRKEKAISLYIWPDAHLTQGRRRLTHGHGRKSETRKEKAISLYIWPDSDAHLTQGRRRLTHGHWRRSSTRKERADTQNTAWRRSNTLKETASTPTLTQTSHGRRLTYASRDGLPVLVCAGKLKLQIWPRPKKFPFVFRALFFGFYLGFLHEIWCCINF